MTRLNSRDDGVANIADDDSGASAMARTAKTFPMARGSAGAAANAAAVHAAPNGIEPARDWASHSLSTAQTALHWAMRLQRQQAWALAAWNEALDGALRDVARSPDLPALMSVSARLADRQFGLTMRHWTEGLSVWLDSEVQLGEQLRDDAAAVVRDMLPGADPANALGHGVAAASPLDVWGPVGRFQQQWLATTQRWVDGARAVTHAQVADHRRTEARR